MAWTHTLNKAVTEWTVSKGAEYLTVTNNSLMHTGDSLSQLYTSCDNINTAYTQMHVRIKYAVTDKEDLLAPHDNPMRHKIYVTVNMFPMRDTDDTDEPDPLYFQAVTIPAAQSYYKKTDKSYAIADVTFPVDTRQPYTKRMVLNLFISRPCIIYAISIKGEYATTDAITTARVEEICT
jgi:hypothetical protein